MNRAAWLWESRRPLAVAVRLALAPAAVAFRAAAAFRNALYDAGALPSAALGAPAVSIGNLTVGGSGKTPLASWIASELRARGRTPAIVLRGFGGDEIHVHERLAPGTLVVANANRVAAAEVARRAGADILVLDDAFQHRRAQRDVDIVLVSADVTRGSVRGLPAGPWREPLESLRRATLIVVTRKAAPDDDVAWWVAAAQRAAPGVPIACVRFELGEAVEWHTGARLSLEALAGRRVLVVSAIGNPAAFEAQLAALGINIEALRYGDHYPFTATNAAALARLASGFGLALCTLKDAVKLGPHWPPGTVPLWYVSQRVKVDRGSDEIARLLDALIESRPAVASLPARPTP